MAGLPRRIWGWFSGIALVAGLGVGMATEASAQLPGATLPSYQDASKPVEERAADLVTAYAGNRLRLRKGGETVDHPAPALAGSQFSGMLDHLSQCVMTNAEPIVSGEEGLRDMRIIEAIYASAREGRTINL